MRRRDTSTVRTHAVPDDRMGQAGTSAVVPGKPLGPCPQSAQPGKVAQAHVLLPAIVGINIDSCARIGQEARQYWPRFGPRMAPGRAGQIRSRGRAFQNTLPGHRSDLRSLGATVDGRRVRRKVDRPGRGPGMKPRRAAGAIARLPRCYAVAVHQQRRAPGRADDKQRISLARCRSHRRGRRGPHSAGARPHPPGRRRADTRRTDRNIGLRVVVGDVASQPVPVGRRVAVSQRPGQPSGQRHAGARQHPAAGRQLPGRGPGTTNTPGSMSR